MSCGLIGMYWVKCKQSNSNTSQITLCLHFLLSCGNQAMTKSAHWCSHGQVICMGSLFLRNPPEGRTETHKSSFCPYKQVSGRHGDHELFRMTNAFILCDLV